MWNSLWLWCLIERSTITITNSTSRSPSRCASRCAIHYGYRAWTFPYRSLGREKRNTKHINISSNGRAGTIVTGTNPHPSQKRDEMAILVCHSTENGRFVPGDRCRFVPGRGPVCPENCATQSVYAYWFFLAQLVGGVQGLAAA